MMAFLFPRRQSEDDASKLASSERAREGQIPRPSGANLLKRNYVMLRCSAAGYLTLLERLFNILDRLFCYLW